MVGPLPEPAYAGALVHRIALLSIKQKQDETMVNKKKGDNEDLSQGRCWAYYFYFLKAFGFSFNIRSAL